MYCTDPIQLNKFYIIISTFFHKYNKPLYHKHLTKYFIYLFILRGTIYCKTPISCRNLLLYCIWIPCNEQKYIIHVTLVPGLSVISEPRSIFIVNYHVEKSFLIFFICSELHVALNYIQMSKGLLVVIQAHR